ncbi:MAG: hypothetical protein HOO96_16225, partial [Polyangiaceae bacterium]|nr:hypothetical protein [Polyangiaceae bacterium]
APPCAPEPVWTGSGGPTEARCNGADKAPVDLLSSVPHCGRCGHACPADLGCADGRCGVGTWTRTGGGADYRVAGVRGETVYTTVTAGAYVYFAPATQGAPPREVVSSLTSGYTMGAVVVDPEWVYARDPVRLVRFPRSVELATATVSPSQLGSYEYSQSAELTGLGDDLLLVGPNRSGVFRTGKAGDGGLTSFLSESAAYTTAADGTGAAYVLSVPRRTLNLADAGPGSARRVETSGNVDSIAASLAYPMGMTTAGEDVLLMDRDRGILRCTRAGNCTELVAGPIDTGVPEEDGSLRFGRVRADATHVYWMDYKASITAQPYRIMKRALCGGESVDITPPALGTRFPTSFQITDSRVYFASNLGVQWFGK